jgi:NAD(P)-dependent dehydrogenase (short-subunit alcohol dehydrogenase family)
MKTPFTLENETALITGGGTGIGLGIARCMLQNGARVVLVGRREEPLAKACADLGGQASFVAADITRLDAAAELVDTATKVAQSPISILVNNAGTHLKKFAEDTTPEDFQNVLITHVLAAHAHQRAPARLLELAVQHRVQHGVQVLDVVHDEWSAETDGRREGLHRPEYVRGQGSTKFRNEGTNEWELVAGIEWRLCAVHRGGKD